MKKSIGLSFVIIVSLFLLTGSFFARKNKNQTECVRELSGMQFRLELKRENILSLIKAENDNIKIPDILLEKALPELLCVSGVIEFDEEKTVLSELKINGANVPYELLTDIVENFLDFECSLVYN